MTSQKTNNKIKNNSDSNSKFNRENREQLKKFAYGVWLISSGCLTASGGGIVGGFLKNHGMMGAAMRIGMEQIKKGDEILKEVGIYLFD